MGQNDPLPDDTALRIMGRNDTGEETIQTGISWTYIWKDSFEGPAER